MEMNKTLNGMFITLMDTYYPKEEREWMQFEMELVDPIYYHEKSSTLLKVHGEIAIDKLLEHWGEMKKDALGKLHSPPIDKNLAKKQYMEWRDKYAVGEAATFMLMGDNVYDRCIGFFVKNHIEYNLLFPEWLKLWKFIILDEGSTMDLERVFRIRKMIQNEMCSRFECEGLTDRLRVCVNSAEPSTVESVKLYVVTWKYWDSFAPERGRRYSEPAPHIVQ